MRVDADQFEPAIADILETVRDIRRGDDFLSVAVGLTLQAQSRYG